MASKQCGQSRKLITFRPVSVTGTTTGKACLNPKDSCSHHPDHHGLIASPASNGGNVNYLLYFLSKALPANRRAARFVVLYLMQNWHNNRTFCYTPPC